MYILKLFFLTLLFSSCQNNSFEAAHVVEKTDVRKPPSSTIKHSEGMTVETRFSPPEGCTRDSLSAGSFGAYLRNLKLLPDGSPVVLYDGTEQDVQRHAAILDMDIGKRDLQQCADAIMRIRAEYFFSRKKYAKIGFHFVNGFYAEYLRWASGERIGIKGNKAYWYGNKPEDYSYSNFRDYLIMVYSFAGTPSLEKELKPRKVETLEIGDVFIQGGSPGHAMLVIDVAKNEKGSKMFMLAQSYMPAQSIHIVKNPGNTNLSPWYALDAIETSLETPSWRFYPSNLKSF